MTYIHYKSTAKNLKRRFYFCAFAMKYGTKIENVKWEILNHVTLVCNTEDTSITSTKGAGVYGGTI